MFKPDYQYGNLFYKGKAVRFPGTIKSSASRLFTAGNNHVLHLGYEKSVAGSHTAYQIHCRQCSYASQGIKTYLHFFKKCV
jgi:hypothetical protein